MESEKLLDLTIEIAYQTGIITKTHIHQTCSRAKSYFKKNYVHI